MKRQKLYLKRGVKRQKHCLKTGVKRQKLCQKYYFPRRRSVKVSLSCSLGGREEGSWSSQPEWRLVLLLPGPLLPPTRSPSSLSLFPLSLLPIPIPYYLFHSCRSGGKSRKTLVRRNWFQGNSAGKEKSPLAPPFSSLHHPKEPKKIPVPPIWPLRKRKGRPHPLGLVMPKSIVKLFVHYMSFNGGRRRRATF